jgi:enoyl reductase-like protein
MLKKEVIDELERLPARYRRGEGFEMGELDEYMFYGLCEHLLKQDEFIDSLPEETQYYFKRRSPLDKMIDESTGRDRNTVKIILQSVVDTMWGNTCSEFGVEL